MAHRTVRAGEPYRHLQALVAVTAASQSLDLEAVLKQSLDALLAATGLDAAEIFLREPDGDLVLAVHRGRFPEPFREITRFSPGQGFPGRVAESGQPLVSTNLAADLRFLRRSVVRAGFQSLACVPLLAGDRVVGTLDVASLDARRFTPDELTLLRAVGRHLGVAVENARLHEELRRRAQTLESEVAARTADLERQQQRIQAILDAAGEGIVVTDRDGTIRYVNPAIARLTGYAPAECAGQNPRLWKSGQTPPEVYRQMWATILAGRSWQGELTNRRKDGTLYPALLTVTPLPGPDGRPEGFVGIQQDLTALKERERDLQERVRLRTLVNAAAEISLSTLDLDELLHRALDALLQWLDARIGAIFLVEPDGTTLTARAARGLGAGVLPVLRARVGRGTAGAAAATGEVVILDNVRSRLADPAVAAIARQHPEVQALLEALRDEPLGTLVAIPLVGRSGVTGVVSLVTPEPRAFTDAERSALRVAGAQLALGIDNARLYRRVQEQNRELAKKERYVQEMQDPLWVVDENNRIVDINPAFTALFGYRREEVLGRDVLEFLDEPDRAVLAAQLEARSRGVSATYELVVHARDGSRIPVLVSGTPLVEDGRITGKIGIMKDIRLRKKLEEDLQERNAELERLTRELESFTYSVSHDLKAPLRGIDGFARALVEDYGDRLDPTARHYLDMICSGVAHMGQLIDALLAYSRLERRELAAGPVELAAVIEQLLADRRFELQERRITVRVALPFRQVRGEPEGFRQLFGNLIDNAIKFTRDRPDPEIVIGGEESDAEQVVWVKDNGIGFDMRYHDRIFQMFQRLHRAEDYPGTGIGLAIARKVVEKLGGRLWAESEPGKGATFYVALPRA